MERGTASERLHVDAGNFGKRKECGERTRCVVCKCVAAAHI